MTTPAPAPAPVLPPEAPKAKTSYGALIALVLIVAAIVAGAFYLLRMKSAEQDLYSSQIEELGNQSTSTEPGAIEDDLTAVSPDEFDAEFDRVFAELEASFEAE